MGLKFIENAGGTQMFYCITCYTYLADKAACVSDSFTGVTGPAYLFSKVINVSLGKMTVREMMTGHHYVRDVHCQGCEHIIGWMYEMAPSAREQYKEGHIILERGLIREVEGITNEDQLNGRGGIGLNQRNPNPMTNIVRQRRALDREVNFRDVFKFDNGIPVITFFDEQNLRDTFLFSDEDMLMLRNTVASLNESIVACSQGNNDPLWDLGFRQDFARRYPEICDIMDGLPYRPSEEADHHLIQLLDRMTAERERDRFHRDADMNDPIYRQFHEQQRMMYIREVRHNNPRGLPLVDQVGLVPAIDDIDMLVDDATIERRMRDMERGIAFEMLLMQAADLGDRQRERERQGVPPPEPRRQRAPLRDVRRPGPETPLVDLMDSDDEQ